jgi:hypothetical protein
VLNLNLNNFIFNMLWTLEYPTTLVDSILNNFFSKMLKFS